MKEGCGCLAIGVLALLVLPLLFIAYGLATAAPALDALSDYYQVSGTGNPTIHNLGYGSSDTVRVDQMIQAINASSPLVRHGAEVLRAAIANHIDPLIIAQWQFESSMGTTGVNKDHNPGNMIWEAMAPYADKYGCRPGPSSLGHHWGWCPNIDASIGIWFEYVGDYYSRRNLDDFYKYVNVYNPCSDPANQKGGFTCGDAYGHAILELVGQTAGPPTGGAAAGGGTISNQCPAPPEVRMYVNGVVFSKTYRETHPPQPVPNIVTSAVHRTDWYLYQGWGPTDFPGEPSYMGYPDFHVGLDINFPGDDNAPAYAIDDGVATPIIWPDGNHVEQLTLSNGITWRYLHFWTQVADGPVKQGDVIGRIGSTGNSSGPHLHLEMSLTSADNRWIAPVQWPCRFSK